MGSLVLKRLIILRNNIMQFLVVLAVSLACVAGAPSGLLSYGTHEVHAPLGYAEQLTYEAPLAYVAPVEAKVHYESRPVVVGQSAQILKPALGTAAAFPVAAPAFEVFRSAPAVEVDETAPFVHAAPVAYPAPLAYAAPVQTKVHYESRPVVVGHSTEILKPALGGAAFPVAAPAFEVVKSAPAFEVVEAAAPVVHAAPVAYPAQLAYAAPVQTKIHYESRPVVVGHSTQILKPALGGAAFPVAAPAFEVF